VQLRGLHVVYADRLVNVPFRRRTEDNGTIGLVQTRVIDDGVPAVYPQNSVHFGALTQRTT
jgi:hypothetical protein